MQQRDRGMLSQGIGREIIQTLGPIVLSQMSMREPIKLSTTHFVLCTQSFNSSRSWLRKLMHWEWRGMEVNFVLGQAINFGKSCFFLMGQEKNQKLVPKPFLTHVFLFLMQLYLAGAFSLMFSCISFIFSMVENLFCIA